MTFNLLFHQHQRRPNYTRPFVQSLFVLEGIFESGEEKVMREGGGGTETGAYRCDKRRQHENKESGTHAHQQGPSNMQMSPVPSLCHKLF